jgi:hypothetical protein
MSNVASVGYIVGSRAESGRLKVLAPQAPVLVLPFPLFAPDPERFIAGKSRSKTNQIPDSELSLSSFECRYKEEIEEFISNCDSVVALAPATESGEQWLAHAYRAGMKHMAPDVSCDCAHYIYLGEDALKHPVSPDPCKLDTDFHIYVFNYVTALWFRSYVLAPFHQKLARTGKGALSLGGATTLLVIALLENRFGASTSCAFTNSSAVAKQVGFLQMQAVRDDKAKQFIVAPIIPNIKDTEIAMVATKPAPLVLFPTTQEYADACNKHYAESWCLMQEQPSTWEQHIQQGSVCLVTDDPSFGGQLREAVSNMRSLITSYGLQLHETQSEQMSLIYALAPSMHMPLVVANNSDNEADTLLNHLREQMFLTYFRIDESRNPKYVYVRAIDDGQMVSVNEDGYAIALEPSETANDFLSLIGMFGFTSGPMTTSAPVLSLEPDAQWLPAVLGVLANASIRSSYALLCLRSLCKRKMLVRVGHRYELTSYGFAYASTLIKFLDRLDTPWQEVLLGFVYDITVSIDRSHTLKRALARAFDLLSVMRGRAAKVTPPTKAVKKTGSDKKTTWTLHFDHKEHVAYWTTRSGKRRAVWYKVKSVTTDPDSGITAIKTSLDMFPKSEKKNIIVLPKHCTECSCIGIRITDPKDTGKLLGTCLKCGATAKHSSVTIIKEFADG